MLKITKSGPKRLEIELSGHLDAEEMAKGLDDLIAKSEGITGGEMLYRIPVFAMPSLGAFGVEFTRLPKLFGLLGKFDRCAVLTDVAWLRTAAEVEGALIPRLKIKAFPLSEEAQAENWLSGGS